MSRYVRNRYLHHFNYTATLVERYNTFHGGIMSLNRTSPYWWYFAQYTRDNILKCPGKGKSGVMLKDNTFVFVEAF